MATDLSTTLDIGSYFPYVQWSFQKNGGEKTLMFGKKVR